MIRLRQLEDADAGRLFDWRRRPEVDRWMYGRAPEDEAAHGRWFEALRADEDRRPWIITADAQPVGLLTLAGLTRANGRVEWGWYIGEPSARGRGAGRAAQVLGLDRAFEDPRARKVVSEVLAGNAAALRAQAAAGFRREGYLRAHVVKDGAAHDAVLLGLLREEWAARREAAHAELAGRGLIAA